MYKLYIVVGITFYLFFVLRLVIEFHFGGDHKTSFTYRYTQLSTEI